MYLETADIETASAEYACRFKGAAGEYFLNRQTELVMELLQDFPGATVLDVGGGHAQIAAPLVAKGFEVTVTGSDDSCRTLLDQRIDSGNFKYYTCDLLNLPFKDRSFSVVLAFRLLPHVKRWQRVLAELCRVADKVVISDYPDRRSTNIFYSQFFSMKKRIEGNTRPFTLFTRKQITEELVRNGFKQPNFHPQFFLPMVVHRTLQNWKVSFWAESLCRKSGLTAKLGSPVIFRADR